MEHAYKFVLRWGSVLAVILIIVWPLLALAAGTFSRSYFYFWVILSIIWGLVRAAARVLLLTLVCRRSCGRHALQAVLPATRASCATP